MTDDGGRRRLDDPADFVVLELKEALERDVHVVPVLLDGATMPRPDELPSALRPLSRRNAVRVERILPPGCGRPARTAPLLLPGPPQRLVNGSPRRHQPTGRMVDETAGRSLGERCCGPLSAWADSRRRGRGSGQDRALLNRPSRPTWIATTGGEVFSSPTVVDGTSTSAAVTAISTHWTPAPVANGGGIEPVEP